MLTIVIPALNEEKYLPLLLQSLGHQTFTDFEIIVADANSRDTTCRIATDFGCWVVPGGPVAYGRNAGALQARGECLLFLDADVTVPPTFLQDLLEKVEKKNLQVASGFITPASRRWIDKAMVTVSNFWHYAIQCFYPHASGFYIFVKKSLHDKIGGFNEELFLTEDHDYVIRAARHGKFRYLWQPRVTFSVRRFDKEGRWRLIWKFLFLEIYMWFKPVKKAVVRYEFGKF